MINRPQIVYLSYYDVINEQKIKSFMAVCANIIEQTKANQLYPYNVV